MSAAVAVDTILWHYWIGTMLSNSDSGAIKENAMNLLIYSTACSGDWSPYSLLFSEMAYRGRSGCDYCGCDSSCIREGKCKLPKYEIVCRRAKCNAVLLFNYCILSDTNIPYVEQVFLCCVRGGDSVGSCMYLCAGLYICDR